MTKWSEMTADNLWKILDFVQATLQELTARVATLENKVGIEVAAKKKLGLE